MRFQINSCTTMLTLQCIVIILSLLHEGVLAQQCRSYNRQAGNCVSIKTCPPLLQVLKSTPTQDQLRQLQKLTCGFDSTDPKVCCPLKEIVQPQPISSTTVQPEKPLLERISGSTDPESDETNSRMEPGQMIPGLAKVGNDLSTHPGFREIPGVKDCGVGLGQDRIIGGKNVSHGTYPWMARIGYKNSHANKIEYFCGGTVISKRYILTAAHCTEGTGEYAPVEIRLAEHDTESESDCNNELQKCSKPEDYKIDKIMPHSKYSPNTKQNDISLIRVDRDIDFTSYFIRPVCLPFYNEYKVEKPENFDRGIVAGWGRTHWNKAEGSQILQEITLPIKNNPDCQSAYKRRVIISPQQLCAGGVSGQDSCGGDSGGPLMIPLSVNKVPRMFQVGIVSFGPVQCGVGGLPGVYARPETYLDWILDTIVASSH